MSNRQRQSGELPVWGWAAILLIVCVVLVVAVLDWLDGDVSGPSLYVLSTLATIAGLIFGVNFPRIGGGK